jgi:Zn-dependent peptidase ImmA (M78 family)
MNDPVDCARWALENKGIIGIPAISLAAIAENEGIRFKISDYPNDAWDGALIFSGMKRAILVNTHAGNLGKNNFTFAHELGHYFLGHKPNFNQDGQLSIRCTALDISNEQQTSEREANRFAVELLMPESRFRLDMTGAPVDFSLIDNLSKQYMVSKHACSNRILNLTQSPCIIVRSCGAKIIGSATSRAVRGFLKRLDAIPVDTAALAAISCNWGQENFSPCASSKWLSHAIPGGVIYECTHVHVRSGRAMTILKW